METRRTATAVAVSFLALLLVSGCASRPELAARGAVAPEGVDFSGQWLLRVDSDSANGSWPGRPGDAEGPIGEAPRRSRTRRPSRQSSSAHLFLETGKSLKVTQTEHGFFVSLDRSVVEEFSFGENRIVTLGPIEAQRVSGWEGATYIVETLDEEGVLLRDKWRLDASGDVLLRNVSLVKGEEVQFSLQQQFDRR